MKPMMILCRLLLVVIALAACATKAGVEMTIREIKQSLQEGMSRAEVEEFYESRRIPYVFTTREQDKWSIPKFPWKAQDAVGYYGGIIRNVRTVWWALASEHITIDVEIDSNNRVSQVLVRKDYTAP